MPGVVVEHSTLVPDGSTTREAAIDDALAKVRREYMAITEKWQQQPTFHVVLTMERPKVGASRACG